MNKRPNIDQLEEIDDEITKQAKILKTNHKDNEIFNDNINILLLFKEAKQTIEPKQIINLDELKQGKYQTDKSKSVENIYNSIKFMIKNLSSLKQHKNETKSLSFIMANRRLLLLELLEYHLLHNNKLTTFKSKLNSIMRIYYLAYNNKDFTTYNQLGTLLDNISIHLNKKEGENKRDDREERNHLDFNIILQRQKELEEEYNLYKNKQCKNAFNSNQDLVLVSLYSLIPTLRRELFSLKYSIEDKREDKDDYLYIKDDNVYLQLNKIVKRHKPIIIDVKAESDKLNEILLKSYKEYPREYLFIKKDIYLQMKPIKTNSLSTRLKEIFSKYNKNVGINSIRSSYISNKLRNPLITYNEKDELCEKMRTGIQYLERNYKKIDKDIVILHRIEVKEPNEYSSIEKDKIAQKRYYDNNKEQIARQQKEYRQRTNKPSYRVKLLRKLNADSNYINKTSKQMIDKYQIVKNEDGIYK